MAKIKVEIPVRLFDRKEAECICDFFSGIKVSWLFCQKESQFVSDATIKEAKNDIIYDATVMFEGEIAAEIDIAHNSIMHYTGPLTTELPHRDISRLKKMIESDPLDEFYEEHIKKLITCIIMASIFAAPSIRLGFRVYTWINGNKYESDSFIEDSLHTEAFRRYASLMTTTLKFAQAFTWIKQYANLQEDSPEPPVPFTMLTYLFNRDSQESLLYSVIGLENLYSAKGKNIAQKLHKRIAYIFPAVTEEQIESMYARRSDFVHGRIKMPIYKDYSDLRNGDFYFDDAAILACTLLLETMRKLAASNAKRILFDVYCSYRFV